MDFEIIDNVYRSRTTLLTILEMRGYNVEPFRKFSPAEIEVAGSVSETFAPLGFVAKHKDFPDQSVDVRYARVSRQKIMSFFEDIPANSQTEVIVMTLDPVTDMHHKAALELFLPPYQIHVSFFHIPHIVNNPLNHFLVPKHEIVPTSEHKALMDKFHMTSKGKFPLVRYHIDPIVRIIGGIPGDIIKITRPSPSAGWYDMYRVVSH